MLAVQTAASLVARKVEMTEEQLVCSTVAMKVSMKASWKDS